VRTTVKAYDGTTVLMSDTIANQQSYPQHSNQKSDGFPLAKLVVWFCVTTGAVLKLQWQRLPPEWKLARQLMPRPTRRCRCSRFCLWHVCGPGLVQRMLMPCFETSCASPDFRRGKVGHWRSYCPMAASWRCLNQCLQKTLSITSKHRSGSPFIDSTTGFRPTEIIWSPL